MASLTERLATVLVVSADRGALCSPFDAFGSARPSTNAEVGAGRGLRMDSFSAGEEAAPPAARWVGPYRIVERLGAGGMGEVYLAEDRRLRRRVALKTLSDTDTPTARERVLREARAAARLNHPNVAAVYDVVEVDGDIHIVMEYVPGETLAARLSQGALPRDTALTIAIQLADALSQAHAMGVLHRDLKPANVILTPENQVKVLDFGLAKMHDAPMGGPSSDSVSREQSSEAAQVVGTPGYVPPERFLGQPADARGDIYSFGVTLFAMLTGRRPFEGKDLFEVGLAAVNRPPPRVREIDNSVSAALDAIVARAMAPNPADRFESAARVAEALRGVQEGKSASASEPTVPLPGRPQTRPSPRIYVSAALVVALIAATYGILQLPLSLSSASASASGSAVVAVLPFASLGRDPAADSVGAGFADILISTLAQIPSVTMVSRDAALEFRGRDVGVTAIARELGADLVVDGTVQTSGDDVRVTLSLLRPGSNRVVWSRSYDGDLGSVFSMQSDVAVAAGQALQLTITPEQRRRLRRAPPTTNVDALADYSQARYFLERPEAEANLERSVELFEAAIAKAPGFARAHAGLGEACWKLFLRTREEQWAEKAVLASRESLRLDPRDASVHVTLALLYEGRGQSEEAAAELRRAIALEPENDAAHRELGRLLLEGSRRSEGFAELQAAVALRPNYWGHHNALALALFQEGRMDEAAQAYQRVTELQPDHPWGYSGLGMVRHAMGDNAAAIELFERSVALGDDSSGPTNLGLVLYAEGRFEEAVRAFAEALRVSPMDPQKHRNLADAYERTGQRERALESYTRAVELCLERLRTNPDDGRTMARLALYEAKLGAFDDAIRHADEAMSLLPQTSEVHYRKAVVLALAERPEDSLAALRRALELGYNARLARDDDDLGILRGRPEFEALTGVEITAR